MPIPTVTLEGPKSMTTENTSLEKAADRTPAVITTPEQYRGALLRWQSQGYNVLTPFTNISGLAAQHGLIAAVVTIKTDRDAGEVYDNSGGLPFLRDGEVALAKAGLRKIAECSGISTRTERTDPRTIPHYWEIKAIATYRGVNGAIVTREATMEWDLRDGSDRLKGFKPNQITEARKNGLRNCETRAINAVIRECGCGLKQKYTRTELQQPFVAIQVMFIPDMSDPETRRMVTERALGGTNAMYPPASRDLPAGEIIEGETSEPRQVGRGSSSSSQASASPAGSTDPDKPPTPDAVRIVKVETKTGKTNNKEWTRYTIVDSTGSEHSTFDKTIAAFAEKARDAKQWVEVAEESDGQYKNLIEIVPAGEQPSLLPNPSDL